MANLKSQGCGIFLSDLASPEVYTEIAQVVSISGPDGSASEIDVTALDSTAKEFLMGLPDEGNVTFEVIHDPSDTQHDQLRTARAAQTESHFSIRLSDSPQTQYNFNGYIVGFAMSLGTDDAVKASYTVRITGSVTKA